MAKKKSDSDVTFYCRKCMRKLKKKHPRRFAFARDFLGSLKTNGGTKVTPRGCLDKCPKKGLMLKTAGEKVSIKPVPQR